MWGLSRLIPAHLEKLVPVLYSIGDIWPAIPDSHVAYWKAPARHRELRSFKAILNQLILKWLKIWGLPATLKFEYAFCNSFSLRQRLIEAGVPLQHAKVIHSGVHLEPFIKASQRQLSDNAAGGLRLLCAGRLYENKGMHVAIEALAEVRRRDGNSNVTLDIVGSGEADYEAYLHKLIEEYNLRDHVSIYPAVPHSQIPDLLAQYDVLVFASFQEGFSRLLIEAMAAGLVIVGTSSCGSGEVWIDEESGLTFEAGDAHHLAHQIERLALDSALRKRLALAGARTVRERFDIERMVDQIEAYLLEVTHGHHEKIP
jgi:glycosyltransferase involved in cell wall biosynthesis